MLEEETYEDVDPPTPCCGSCLGPVIRQEEAIELVEIKGDVKEVVECLICNECFDTISLLENHMSSTHQIDREKLIAYKKFLTSKTTTEEGNRIFSIIMYYMA